MTYDLWHMTIDKSILNVNIWYWPSLWFDHSWKIVQNYTRLDTLDHIGQIVPEGFQQPYSLCKALVDWKILSVLFFLASFSWFKFYREGQKTRTTQRTQRAKRHYVKLIFFLLWSYHKLTCLATHIFFRGEYKERRQIYDFWGVGSAVPVNLCLQLYLSTLYSNGHKTKQLRHTVSFGA